MRPLTLCNPTISSWPRPGRQRSHCAGPTSLDTRLQRRRRRGGPGAGDTTMRAGVACVALLLQLCWLARAGSDTVWVTCGSTIKLAHSSSGARLHSHEVAYSRGSQQQSVTGYPDSGDGRSYWVVHGPTDELCAPGSPIKKQSRIRLQHAPTRRWLHSHQFYSPISGNQEVSAFGDDSSSDGGDVWLVEWDGKAKHWKQDSKVRLKHKDTGMYMSSSRDFRFGQPIHGQQEVCGVGQKTRDTDWFAAEGVYLPRGDRKAKEGGKDKEDAGGEQGADGDRDREEL